MKPIQYARTALKTLRSMPAPTAKRIVTKVEAYAADPASQANNVKALKGSDDIRLRVGDWRVIMNDGVVLTVTKIGSRGSVYE
ncbi:type II toxin-antitoxin system RelE/ParE family toxin [Novosphingobium sp. HII-3]|uniref:type II toxin-antitoxin system RelE family toxin n=1 Tax=Novosphingobium sp. HII-3 TaxID=2075565 RepID=UPI000CDA3791|nr:type II toxin-antitoxin system RelE/ParE family toxin [Novosphingobium sp. HII-3]